MERKDGWKGPPPPVKNETSNISLQLQSLLNVPSTKVTLVGDQRSSHVNDAEGRDAAVGPRNRIVTRAGAPVTGENLRRADARVSDRLSDSHGRIERFGDHSKPVDRSAERESGDVVSFMRPGATNDVRNDDSRRVFDRVPVDKGNMGPYRRNEKVAEAFPSRNENTIADRLGNENAYRRMSGFEDQTRRMESDRDHDIQYRRLNRATDYENKIPSRPLENLSNHSMDRSSMVMERTDDSANVSHGRYGGGGRESSILGPRRVIDTVRKQEADMISKLCSSKGCPRSLQRCVKFFVDDAMRIEDSLGHKANFNMLSIDTKSVLNYHFIDILLRRSPKFTRAKYYCTLCSYHTDTLFSTLEHICNERHLTLEKAKRTTDKIYLLPKPSAGHMQALKSVLDQIYVENIMTKVEKDKRAKVFNELQQIVFNVCGADFPRLSYYGTSFTGLGFADANLNLNIEVPEPNPSSSEATNQSNGVLAGPEYVSHLVTSLENRNIITNVKEKYSGKKAFASFDFEYQSTVYSCVLTLNNRSATTVTELLDEYHKLESRLGPLIIGLRTLARKMGIDDQENGYLPSHCFPIMVIHYMQAIGAIPVLHELPHVALTRAFATANEAIYGGWNTSNNSHVGKLWIDMLRYYSFDFDYKSTVISISRVNVRKKDEKCWNRWISIEDPISQNVNLTRSMTNKTCDFVVDRLRAAYIYFAIPRCIEGALYDAVEPDRYSNRHDTFSRIVCVIEDGNQYTVVILDGPDAQNFSPHHACRYLRMEMTRCYDDYDETSALKSALQTESFQKIGNFLPISSYDYKFDHLRSLPGQNPPLSCKSCGSDSHVKKDCPDEILPPVTSVDWPAFDVIMKIQDAIMTNFHFEVLNQSDVDLRMILAAELEGILKSNIPLLKLSLFGSTMNGFGLKKSDLDLCLTFVNEDGKEELTQKDCDATQTLRKIVSALKASGLFVDIVAIASAKVPIVKFRHKHLGIEGDISLYNILARENTNLLKAYCEIDQRVQILGLFLKKFVKVCDISDASKGSLSSYGYILMLIHFLQNCSPPVLPVLQQFQRPAQHPRTIPDTYFFNDVNRLKQEWSHVENNNHVVVLWMQFLQYYVEEFDFDKYVVSISRTDLLTRKEKGWMTESIAIEDPFDTTHNLGAGLSSRMSNHIRKAFIRAREHFFRPPTPDLRVSSNLEYYMYDSELRGSDPPIDRQCRICRKIGHFARRCPSMGRGGNDMDSDDSSDVPNRATENESSPEKNIIREESSEGSDQVVPGFVKQHRQPEQVGPDSSDSSILSPQSPVSNGMAPQLKEVVGPHGYRSAATPPFVVTKPENVFGSNRNRIIELTGHTPEDLLVAASKYKSGFYSAQEIEASEDMAARSANRNTELAARIHQELEKVDVETDSLQEKIAELKFQDMIRKSKGVSFASHLTDMVKVNEFPHGQETEEATALHAPLTYNDPESPMPNNLRIPCHARPRSVEESNLFQPHGQNNFGRSIHEAEFRNPQPQNMFPNSQNINDSMFGTFPVHALSAPPPGFTQLSAPMRPIFNYCGPVMSSSLGGEISRGNLAHQVNRGAATKVPENFGAREQYRMPNMPAGGPIQMTADSQLLMDAYAKKAGLPMPLPQPNMYGMQPEFSPQFMYAHFIPNNSATTSQGSYVPQQNMTHVSPQTSFMSQSTSHPPMYNPYVPVSSYEQVPNSFPPQSSQVTADVTPRYSPSSAQRPPNDGPMMSNSLNFAQYPHPQPNALMQLVISIPVPTGVVIM